MPVQAISGRQVHTQVLGDAGPVVVMVHGLISGSTASWYFSIAPLLARGHRVVMYDLRGHGLTEPAATGYGLRSMAGDLDQVIRHFAGDAPVALVGQSYGAVIALRFALDQPARVSRLVMVEAPLPVISDTWMESLANTTTEAFPHLLPPWQRQALEGSGRRSRRLVAHVVALVSGTTMLDDMKAEPDVPDAELAAFGRPVLLCYGTHTAPALVAACTRLAQVLPDARVRMLVAGHHVHREAPVQLAAAIREFLHA
jgi:pimeloyl-ACP methyl ester carboxylesterase